MLASSSVLLRVPQFWHRHCEELTTLTNTRMPMWRQLVDIIAHSEKILNEVGKSTNLKNSMYCIEHSMYQCQNRGTLVLVLSCRQSSLRTELTTIRLMKIPTTPIVISIKTSATISCCCLKLFSVSNVVFPLISIFYFAILGWMFVVADAAVVMVVLLSILFDQGKSPSICYICILD